VDREVAQGLLREELEVAASVAGRQRELLSADRHEMFDEMTSIDQHQADAASDTLEREQALTILQIAETRRIDIERALEKVAAGRYGTCEQCHEPISEERLEAFPDARFCERDQRDWELGRIGFRVGRLPAPQPEVPEPGWVEMAFLPDDDEVGPGRRQLSAEEAAMHLEVTEEDEP
jgi:DnaK suppressor protein